MTFNIPLVCY